MASPLTCFLFVPTSMLFSLRSVGPTSACHCWLIVVNNGSEEEAWFCCAPAYGRCWRIPAPPGYRAPFGDEAEVVPTSSPASDAWQAEDDGIHWS